MRSGQDVSVFLLSAVFCLLSSDTPLLAAGLFINIKLPVFWVWPVMFMKSLLDDEPPADNLVLVFDLIHPHLATEAVISSDLGSLRFLSCAG